MKRSLPNRYAKSRHDRDELRSLHKDVNNQKEDFLQQIEDDWNDFSPDELPIVPERTWEQINRQTADESEENVFRLQWWVRIAATILIIVGAWFIFKPEISETPQTDEGPGLITETNEGNQPIQVSLKDGTKVILAANSSLSYYENFNSRYRVVRLEGEADFVTDEENKRPFVVISGNLTSICRGKEFSISAREESEIIDITSASGQIEIARNDRLNSEANKVAVRSCQKYSFNKSNDQFLINQVSECEFDQKVES